MTRRRLGLALAAVVVLALGVVVWRAGPRREFALPAALRVAKPAARPENGSTVSLPVPERHEHDE